MPYSSIIHPEDIPKVFVEAWNMRDAGRLAQLFDQDAEFINVTGLWWHSRQDIEKAHAYGLQTIFLHSLLRLLKTKVKYLSDHIAVVQAKMELSGQSPVGTVQKPGIRKTIFSFVVHKTTSGWSCASAQNTDIVAGMETHVRDEQGKLLAADYRKKETG